MTVIVLDGKSLAPVAMIDRCIMRSRSLLKIRKMKRSDADCVAEMMAALAAYHGDESKVAAPDFLTHGHGSSKLATIWLAISGAAPAGFAVTYDWTNFVRVYPVRHIDLLFVHEPFRRMGVASALLDKIVCDAKLSGIQRVTVGAAEENRGANAFYQKLGFAPRNDASVRYQIACANFERLTTD